MNQQLPFFMPMYPNRLDTEIDILRKRIDALEERIINLEKTKLINLDNPKKDKDYFKEGYMI